jgi:hypothetical protein
MVLNIASAGHMGFRGDGYQDINFGRAIHHLYVYSDLGAELSLDNGKNYMILSDATTHIFPRLHTNKIIISGGTWNGFGIGT